MKFKKYILALFLWCSSLFAQGETAFSHLFVSLEFGEIYPWGRIEDAVEHSLVGGAGLRYTYWENVDGFLTVDYMYFKPIPDEVPYDGAHQLSGKIGMEWKLPFLNSIRLGGGFICNMSYADAGEGQPKNDDDRLPGGTLYDKETEFGWFGRLNLPIWNLENYRVGLNFIWEELWTLPKRSNMLSVLVYVERKIW